MTQTQTWVAETVALADAIVAEIEARIASGVVPPRPEGYEEWRRWYAEHIGCAVCRYQLRNVESALCPSCIREGRSHAKGVMQPHDWRRLAEIGFTNPRAPITTTVVRKPRGLK
jgi:hypothetical protein